MPVDGKYGQVTLEHGTVADNEPVVVFRGQDELVVPLLWHYLDLCTKAGSPERHLQMIRARIAEVVSWQATHETQVPNSESSRAWLPG